jgi:hypothetical protein
MRVSGLLRKKKTYEHLRYAKVNPKTFTLSAYVNPKNTCSIMEQNGTGLKLLTIYKSIIYIKTPAFVCG